MYRRLSLLVIALLVGCRESVVTNLSQRQAIEVVGFLGAHGIDGIIVPLSAGANTRFEVRTESSVTKKALIALSQAGLPSVEGLTSDQLLNTHAGLVPPSSFVERHQMDRALAAQLEEMLALLPGVVGARVIVRLHTVGPSSAGRLLAAPLSPPREGELPGLSVVLRVRGDDDLRDQVLGILKKVFPEISEQQIFLTVVSQETNKSDVMSNHLLEASDGEAQNAREVPQDTVLQESTLAKPSVARYEGIILVLFLTLIVIYYGIKRWRFRSTPRSDGRPVSKAERILRMKQESG